MDIDIWLCYLKIASVNWDLSYKAKLTFTELPYVFYDFPGLNQPKVTCYNHIPPHNQTITQDITIIQTLP